MKASSLTVLSLVCFATISASAGFVDPAYHITEVGQSFFLDFPAGLGGTEGPTTEDVILNLAPGWTAVANSVFPEPPGQPGFNYITANGGGTIRIQSGFTLPGTDSVLSPDSSAGTIQDPSGNTHLLFFKDMPNPPPPTVPEAASTRLLLGIAMAGLLPLVRRKAGLSIVS